MHGAERHVPGRAAVAAAIVEIEAGVAGDQVIAGLETEQAAGAIDGAGGALEFEEDADGGLVELDEEMAEAREAVGGAVFFIAEAGGEADCGEEPGQGSGIGDDGLELFADFIAEAGTRTG